MARIRKCDALCHNAKGTRCRCWCGGFFHGKDGAGAANRQALKNAERNFLEQHGFERGKTAYIEQPELPLDIA
jgi:hypothetical protein